MTFSFSKGKTFCGEQDTQIRFSKKWTFVNSFVSTSVLALVTYWLASGTATRQAPGSWNLWWYIFSVIFIPPVGGHIIGVIFITLFAFFDQICCYCCECWRGEQELVVYDPDNPSAALVISNGAVVDINQRYETEETEESEV